MVFKAASCCARIFALGARERLLTAMNQLVLFQAVGPSGCVVALVAVVFLFQTSLIPDVEIFFPFYGWLFHDLASSLHHRNLMKTGKI